MTDVAQNPAVLDALSKVKVDIVVTIGKSTMPIRQLLKVGRGAIVDLATRHDAPVLVYGNGELIAKGEVVIVGERIGVTISEIIDENSDL
ncbi:MAG: FliM/FliN family flagellar motor switch protein [Sphingomonadales bacterium]